MSHITNPLVLPEQLLARSSLNALPPEVVDAVFFCTQGLTQAAGLLLQLPQSVTAQANVLLARYWAVEPMTADEEFSDVSAATLYLVAKLGPLPRSTRDLAHVYTYLLSTASPLFRAEVPNPPDPNTYYLSPTAYTSFQTRLLSVEALILRALAFDTHVVLPHPFAIIYLQALSFFAACDEHALARLALRYLNTALLSPQMVYLTHQPPALAVAAVYAAARDLGVRMPGGREWWEIFDVDREELGFLVVAMRSVGAAMEAEEQIWWRGGGMVTKKRVEMELMRRGLIKGVEDGGGEMVDEEAETIKRLDERSQGLEG